MVEFGGIGGRGMKAVMSKVVRDILNDCNAKDLQKILVCHKLKNDYEIEYKGKKYILTNRMPIL